MKPITVWRSQEITDGVKVWVHHHIEDGHSDSDKPIVLKDEDGEDYKDQKGWKKMIWEKEWCYLQNNVVVHK